MKVTKTESRVFKWLGVAFGMSSDLNEVELEPILCPE
jgi:hypothetical protein